MMASILDKLDSLGDQPPHRLLYSFIDLNGKQIGAYSYESFLHRTKVIAGHLRKEHGFAPQDRLLLAFPRGMDPAPSLSPQFSWLPECPVQNGPHRKGLPGGGHFNEPRLPRIPEDKS